MYACRAGHAEVAHLLLANGAGVLGARKDDASALHEAAAGGHVEVVEALLDRGGVGHDLSAHVSSLPACLPLLC